MVEIEQILWDFLRGVRQGSFHDDAILVKGCKNKLEKVVAAATSESRTLQTTDGVEEKRCPTEARLHAEEQASTEKELTTPGEDGKTSFPPPPLVTPTPQTTAMRDKKRDTSDQRGERDTASTTKSVPSVSDFAPKRKQKQSNLPSPPTRGEFFIWFPFEEFGDLSVSDGILRFFLEASRPAGNPLACNLTVQQVAKWYVHKLSLGAFSRYTPRGHTRGVQAFWANLGKWSKSGLEELEEAAVWCRRVGTANKVAHAKRDREVREKLEEKREWSPAGEKINWEEF